MIVLYVQDPSEFAILNPKSTITEVCDGYNHLWKKEEGFIHGDLISENRYIVSYWKERIAAVQLAAAITAADIEKDISREDCYYIFCCA